MTGMRKLYGETKYLIVFLCDSVSVMFGDKRTEIEELLNTIGAAADRSAGVVYAPPGKWDDQLQRVRDRLPAFYAEDIEPRLPCLLIIENHWDEFDPRRDQWAVVALEDLIDEHGQIDAKLCEKFARAMIAAIRDDNSIFETIVSMKADRNRSLALRAIQIRPGAFGISCDVRAVVELLSRKFRVA